MTYSTIACLLALSPSITPIHLLTNWDKTVDLIRWKTRSALQFFFFFGKSKSHGTGASSSLHTGVLHHAQTESAAASSAPYTVHPLPCPPQCTAVYNCLSLCLRQRQPAEEVASVHRGSQTWFKRPIVPAMRSKALQLNLSVQHIIIIIMWTQWGHHTICCLTLLWLKLTDFEYWVILVTVIH